MKITGLEIWPDSLAHRHSKRNSSRMSGCDGTSFAYEEPEVQECAGSYRLTWVELSCKRTLERGPTCLWNDFFKPWFFKIFLQNSLQKLRDAFMPGNIELCFFFFKYRKTDITPTSSCSQLDFLTRCLNQCPNLA